MGEIYEKMKQALEFAAMQNLKAIGAMGGLTAQERARLALSLVCVTMGGATAYYTALFADIANDTWEDQVDDFLKVVRSALIECPVTKGKAH